MSARIVERLFALDPSGILPPIMKETEPFWSGLERGSLLLQHCSNCSRPRYPISPVCPHCGSTDSDWRTASGCGRLFSWVQYHRAYLPEFQDRLPYYVALVELEEGVRLFGMLHDQTKDPVIGASVKLVIERWPGGRCVPAFSCMGDA